MLDALRRGSTGWVAKILFSLLVLSFAVWGVADVFTGFGRGSIAKVGEQEIRQEDYQRAFQNEINLISQQAGRRITTEQARAAGLDNRVLAQLIAWAAVEEHAQKLGLTLSDDAIVEGIRNDPNLHGPDGRFSMLAFQNVLDRLGMSERGFVALRRRDEMREQLTSALITGVAVPDYLIDLVYNWREEKRTAEHFTIDAGKAVTVADPDEAKLKETYEANKAQFMAPEFRKLAILALTPDTIKNNMEVTDAEAQAAYEQTKASYNVPERRRIQQLSFKDLAAAQAAKKEFDGGKSFGDVAKESGAKDSDIDLGLITKDRLIDPKIADAAFSLEKDKVSDPVEGRFTTVILRVTDIQPAVEKTYADVQGEVRDKLATEKARDQLHTLLDQVEDHRAGGKPLKEIADEMKLQFFEVAQTDRNNTNYEGKPAVVFDQIGKVLPVAFNSGVGIENEVIELDNGGFAWVDVLDITPSKLKPFDEVKEAVKKFYLSQERMRLVTELANKLVERADKGEPLATLAKEAGDAKVETSPPFNRTTTPQGMSRDAVTRAFTLAKGKAGSAPDSNDTTRIVFKVTEITPAGEPTKEQRERIVTELKNQLADETLSGYVVALQDRLGTNINEEEFKRATGADAATQ
jgi:peptidyl-prolyl cis-trans isomerase D